MRGFGLVAGVVAGMAAVVGGCQLIAGVEDAVPYPPDAGGGSKDGGATCKAGTRIPCPYAGPAGTENIGICRAGAQNCSNEGVEEGVCSGEVTPQVESCASTEDENCDGLDCVQWAELFGDSGEQVATSIAIDAMGNSFVGGYFSGVIPFGGSIIKAAGNTDAFLLKFDPSGKPIWGIGLGNASDPQIIDSVATDPDGNVLLTGFSFSPFSIGTTLLPEGPFVAKFDKDGKYTWSKGIVQMPCSIGSPGNASVATDLKGDVIVAGSFCGTLDFGDGLIKSQGPNKSNGFIAKLKSKNGSGKVSDGGWVKAFGDGLNNQGITSVSVAPTDEILVIGEFEGTLTFGASLTSAGGSDVFVTKLSTTGTPYWSFQIGGASDDTAGKIAVDKFGGPFVFGSFNQSISLDGQTVNAIGGNDNRIIVKISTDKTLEWHKELPSGFVLSAALDENDNISLTGIFENSIDLGAGKLNTTTNNFALFVAKLTKGGTVVWNKSFGEATQALVIPRAVAFNKNGDPIVVGGVTIPINFGAGLMTPLSSSDGFLVKFAP